MNQSKGKTALTLICIGFFFVLLAINIFGPKDPAADHEAVPGVQCCPFH